MASLMRVLVAAQLGPRHPVVRGRVVLPGLALPPHRLQLGLVHHQQADEHEEPPQHHGSRHPLGGVVLGVESLLFGSQSLESVVGAWFLAGGQKGR